LAEFQEQLLLVPRQKSKDFRKGVQSVLAVVRLEQKSAGFLQQAEAQQAGVAERNLKLR
jgi:hypothetical protein